ncbi:hypothetical protein ACFX1T_012858 [Malus domestica]
MRSKSPNFVFIDRLAVNKDHKKGGRIRTYGQPTPDPFGWVAMGIYFRLDLRRQQNKTLPSLSKRPDLI